MLMTVIVKIVNKFIFIEITVASFEDQALRITPPLIHDPQTRCSPLWQSPNEYEYHTITPLSLGLLASTTGIGLMEDLSLFPDLIGVQFTNVVSDGAQAANAKSGFNFNSIDALRQTVNLRGIDAMGGSVPLDGAIAMAILPKVSSGKPF